MKKASAFIALVCLLLLTSFTFAPSAHAMFWRTGDRSNIIDCRSGWYCATGGWINWRASYDYFWENILWGN